MENTVRENTVLSPEDVTCFEQHGYVYLPRFAELTGLTSESTNRTKRFMEEITEVDGVSVKVIEVTGEPGDAYLCHPAIYHAASPNHAEVPRFMRVKGLAKQTNPST